MDSILVDVLFCQMDCTSLSCRSIIYSHPVYFHLPWLLAKSHYNEPILCLLLFGEPLAIARGVHETESPLHLNFEFQACM